MKLVEKHMIHDEGVQQMSHLCVNSVQVSKQYIFCHELDVVDAVRPCSSSICLLLSLARLIVILNKRQ